MHWITSEGITVNKTAWIGRITWIIFDDFTVKDTKVDFVKGQSICLGFLVGVILNTYSIVSYCVNDIFYIHAALPYIV
jgi:hypothetical protein